MLLSTVVKAVKRKSHRGSQSITTDQITTDVLACINEAIRDVSKMIPKRFWFKQGTAISLTSGVAGTAAVYSLASDVHEPISFHYTVNSTFYKLSKVDSDREWFDHVWSPTAATGLPTVYRDLGNNQSTGYRQIEIFPIPNQSISLANEYYKTKATDLTTSDLASQIPDIPDWCQDAVEKGALYYFLKQFDDPNQKIALADYEQAKLDLDEDDQKDQDSDLRIRFNVVKNTTPGFKLI